MKSHKNAIFVYTRQQQKFCLKGNSLVVMCSPAFFYIILRNYNNSLLGIPPDALILVIMMMFRKYQKRYRVSQPCKKQNKNLNPSFLSCSQLCIDSLKEKRSMTEWNCLGATIHTIDIKSGCYTCKVLVVPGLKYCDYNEQRILHACWLMHKIEINKKNANPCNNNDVGH